MNSKKNLVLEKKRKDLKKLSAHNHSSDFFTEFNCQPSNEDAENDQHFFNNNQNELAFNVHELTAT
jgi:hypothetical protein